MMTKVLFELLPGAAGVVYLQMTSIADGIFEFGAFGVMMGVIIILARLVALKYHNGHLSKAADKISDAATSIVTDAAGLHVGAQQLAKIEERLGAIEHRVTTLEAVA